MISRGGGRGEGGLPSVRYRRTDRQPDTRHSDQISRSACRDGATKNVHVKQNHTFQLCLYTVNKIQYLVPSTGYRKDYQEDYLTANFLKPNYC